MKKNILIFAAMVAFALGLAGCGQKNSQPTLHAASFHVISYDSCGPTQVVGTSGKMRFDLNHIGKMKGVTNDFVVCSGLGESMGLDSIGKDFPAVIVLDNRELVELSLPVYADITLEEVHQGKTRGKQTGTEQVPFKIERMREQ